MVFGKESSDQDYQVFEYIERRAPIWKTYDGKFIIVDTDKFSQSAATYSITNALTFIFFDKKGEIHRFVVEDEGYQYQLNDYIVSKHDIGTDQKSVGIFSQMKALG